MVLSRVCSLSHSQIRLINTQLRQLVANGVVHYIRSEAGENWSLSLSLSYTYLSHIRISHIHISRKCVYLAYTYLVDYMRSDAVYSETCCALRVLSAVLVVCLCFTCANAV